MAVVSDVRPVSAADFPEVRWRGHWIWVPEEPIVPRGFRGAGINPHAPEAHGLFRAHLSLETVPDRAATRLTADSRYILHVNGHEVCRGPIRGQPRRLHYDLVDLAPFLRSGDNVVTVHVRYYGRPTSWWFPAVPNQSLGRSGILVFEADLGRAGWLVSDGSWRARKSDAWSDDWRADDLAAGRPEAMPLEAFDARRFPADWTDPAFDDSDWGLAQPVPAMHVGGWARTQPPTDPYGPLFPRPIAFLDGAIQLPASILVESLSATVIDTSQRNPVDRAAATIGQPATVASDAATLPLRLTIDMGRVVSGFVQFDVAAQPGTTLDVCLVEEPLRTDTTLMLRMRVGLRYIARGTDDRFEGFDTNGFRYAYILVHGASTGFQLKGFSVREHLYPFTPGARFESDDADLNRLFTAGVRTVQLNSHDAFLDCPTREQRAWVGDSVVHQMVHLATNTDWRLAWHWLETANSPRSDGMLPMSVAGDIEADAGLSLPDWALHWIHGVYNRYWFSGDRDAVKALLPSVERVLRWYLPFLTRGGALKDVTEWNLIDWASISNEDTSGVVTAIWARGLREYAEMAGWLEERASQRWAMALYERVKAGFDVFWDDRRGTYVDHLKDGVQQPELSQLGGALAIVSGLAPESRWRRIVDTITDEQRLVVRSWMGGAQGEYSAEKRARQNRGIYEIDWDTEREIVLAEPFMSYVVHDAVARAGLAERLPDLHRRWLQFLTDGYDTIGECWGWGTHVHAWSTAPTRDLLFYTLGITPAEPGYTKARIAPRLGRLTRARGTVPTPHGLLTVDVSDGAVTIDSPVPVVLDLAGQPPRELPAGRATHQVVLV